MIDDATGNSRLIRSYYNYYNVSDIIDLYKELIEMNSQTNDIVEEMEANEVWTY